MVNQSLSLVENLTLNTDIVLICRLILEEYFTQIEYIQGGKNIISDSLS